MRGKTSTGLRVSRSAWKELTRRLERRGREMLDFAFPESCQSCGDLLGPSNRARDELDRVLTYPLCRECDHLEPWVPDPESFCPVCAEKLDEDDWCPWCRDRSVAFERLRCPFLYRGRHKELTRAWKFEGRHRLDQFFLRHSLPFRDRLGEVRFWEREGWCLVPVPESPRRVKQNGRGVMDAWNQQLARDLGIERHTLFRKTGGLPQHFRSRGEREIEVGRCYRRVKKTPVPANVLLVDDIVTTGTTVNYLAHWLRELGARRVEVVALFKTPSQETAPLPASARLKTSGRQWVA